MNEARRFLRYLSPGLLFGVETLVLLLIALPDWTISYLTSLKGNEGVGIALGSLLASGALGFLFSTIHHWCHWRLPFDRAVIDHAPMVRDLLNRGLLNLDPAIAVDRRMALDVTLALWYERLRNGTPIGDADRNVAALRDIAHSAGTGRVASVFALVTVIYICATAGSFSLAAEPMLRFTIMVVLGVGSVVLFHDTYVRTGGMAQRLIDRLLTETMERERGNEVQQGAPADAQRARG